MELEEARKYLEIDRDALDACLEQQPELYHDVALQYEQAVSVRDLAKLELEEAQADIADRIRSQAADNKERVTEGAIDQKVTVHHNVKKLERELLAAKVVVGAWAALKEGYQQRSYMLRSIVDRSISSYGNLSLEAGSFKHRTAANEKADRIRIQAAKERQLRRQK